MLKLAGVSKAYDAFPLFTRVSLVLGSGDRVGLVGPNGTGKSTLLRLAAGLERPDDGAVTLGSEDRVGFLAQQPDDPGATVHGYLAASAGEVYALHRELPALQEALDDPARREAAIPRFAEAQERYAALGGWTLGATIDEVRRRLGVAELPDDAPFAELSGGEQARLMLAGVLLARPTVLLLDEPTNHLDLDGVRWLEQYLTSFPGGVLVVSHDRRFLDNSVHSVLELDGVHEEPQLYAGGYSAYRVEKEHRFARLVEQHRAQERARRALEAEIARLKGRAQGIEARFKSGPGADYARALAKKVARQSKTRERRLERQMASPEWIEDPERAPTFSLRFEAASVRGRRLAALEGVDVELGGRRVLAGVDLVVRGQDRVGVIGPNGAGKTTLLELLAGALEPTRGRVERTAPAAVLPQEHHELALEQPLLPFYRSRVVGHEHEARMMLGHFLFESEFMGRPLGTLSPGERARLLIAVLLSSRAELLLLDEPTNHLDFDSLDVVESALAAFKGTVVAVSHDRAFLENIGCSRVLELRDGRLEERPADVLAS